MNISKTDRRSFLKKTALSGLGIGLAGSTVLANGDGKVKKIGMVGLDTSHAPAFAKYINGKDHHFKITAAYTTVSRDLPASNDRVEKFTAQIRGMGIEIVDTLSSLLKQVDYVLLTSVDGRRHLKEVTEIFKSGKRVFIDKPVAGSLEDAIAIYKASEKYKLPTFSCSGTRFLSTVQEVRNGSIGEVMGADTFSPVKYEPTHPELFWYGIHGTELLFTVMGAGCKKVRRTKTDQYDIVTGDWGDGRIGTFRGIRGKKGGYGGQAFGTKGLSYLGGWENYDPTVDAALKYFEDGIVPVEPRETIEIYAFMEAAHESTRQNGDWVTLDSVLTKAGY